MGRNAVEPVPVRTLELWFDAAPAPAAQRTHVSSRHDDGVEPMPVQVRVQTPHVGAPLPDVAAHVETSETTRALAVLAHGSRGAAVPVAGEVCATLRGLVIAPRESADAAGRFPLRFARKRTAHPRCVRTGCVPAHTDDGLETPREASVAPWRGCERARRCDERAVLVVRYRCDAHLKRRELDLVRGVRGFGLLDSLSAHDVTSGRHGNRRDRRRDAPHLESSTLGRMRWQGQATGTTEKLLGVWCGPTETVAVGERGAVVRRGDDRFAPLASGTTENLYAVHGIGSTLVAVGGNLHVGGNSLILHRRGDRPDLVTEHSGMQHILLTVTHGANGWLAAGYNGAILRGGPGRWARDDVVHYQHVFASCAVGERTFVGGLGGSVLELTRGVWRHHETGVDEHIRALAADREDHVVAVGLGGLILRFDGSRWQRMPSPTQASLEGVWLGAGEGFAVGQGGAVLYYDGSRWSPADAGTDADLCAVHGHGAAVVAVGARGVACALVR